MEELRRVLNTIQDPGQLSRMVKRIDKQVSEMEGDLSVYEEADKTAPGIAERIDALEMFIQEYKLARFEVKKRIVTLDLIDNLKKACSYEKNI
jgi:hypothetical protein